ncbi:molybdate ABC transporter substrate-binding protein [Nibrella saemangeumensis]|uniref:Molybdate ABC transporter substrate-binding protein n=1 Tax=Nibrella saemangeumensis TaxID=1084526 RepID=A0ABP8MIS8_9BACT
MTTPDDVLYCRIGLMPYRIHQRLPAVRPLLILLLVLVFRLPAPAQPGARSREVTIAAASDLRYAMDALTATFRRRQPAIKVNVVYGSSGKFFQQISRNAPFDLFFSADIDYPRQLQQKALTASPIQTYAIGRLVLWSPTIDPNTLGLKTLLDPSIRTIAIANPLHAPYGKRAEESLRHYGLYDQVKARFVKGENIAQTAQFVSSGAADIGIIALALAMSPPLKAQGRYFLIPANTHTSLEQGYVVLKRARNNKAAFTFASFLTTPPAKAILKQYGFAMPN